MAASRAREIFNDSRLTLIIIESIDVQHSIANTDCRLFGFLKPIALMVYETNATYVLDMKSKPITIDQLKQDVPDLDRIIAPFNKPQN